MTTSNCTASLADHGNITYPSLVTNRDYHYIAEDKPDYSIPLRLPSKALKTYLDKRLEDQRELPIRIHMLLDDLSPLLRKRKQVDVFDLLVELILLADHEPAQCLCALLAVLDDDALIDLEPLTVKRTGQFVHDTLKPDMVRWHLQDYRENQKEKRKQKKQG